MHDIAFDSSWTIGMAEIVGRDEGRSPSRILLVDDDASLRGLVREFLESQRFEVYEAESGAAMRRILEVHDVEIVVLDVMMPDEDGLSIARTLTQERPRTGVIFVSALGSLTDRVVGLEVGADDYLAKPIEPRELLARIRALLRRRSVDGGASGGAGHCYGFAGWRMDPARRLLRDPSGVVTMISEGEFSLLLALVEHPQRILTRDQLLEMTKGHESDVFDRAIDTQISRLRGKLGVRNRDEMIRTIRNVGYIFVPPVSRGRG